MEQTTKTKGGFSPALTLMIMAPMLTEVLPGATRFSSIFVFPVEMCVWGGGAVLIRYAVRRWQLGWLGMLLLAVGLAIAEECLIQQTSLAPLVIRLKGVTYARAFGVNYVYMLWALIYEPVLVVFAPVYLVELIFPERARQVWVSKTGLFVLIPLFLLGSILAWFSWTQIARVKVFHLPAYHPPHAAVIIAFLVICGLVFTALRVFRNAPQHDAPGLKPLPAWPLGIIGAIWPVPLYGLVLLGFGIMPSFPPLIAIAAGLLLAWLAIFVVSRWAAHINWNQRRQFALVCGVITGAMLIGFIGFMDTRGADLYFKVITNIIAVILLIMLGMRVQKRTFSS